MKYLIIISFSAFILYAVVIVLNLFNGHGNSVEAYCLLGTLSVLWHLLLRLFRKNLEFRSINLFLSDMTNRSVTAYIAQDRNGAIYMFETKPEKNVSMGVWQGVKSFFLLDPKAMGEVQLNWEDDEPMPVKICLYRTDEAE